MDEITRWAGPDGLVVDLIRLDGSACAWAKFAGVRADWGLLVTKGGAWVGLYDGPGGLAAVVDLGELRPAAHGG
jgi:hypothetical protein